VVCDMNCLHPPNNGVVGWNPTEAWMTVCSVYRRRSSDGLIGRSRSLHSVYEIKKLKSGQVPMKVGFRVFV
jgi:hypothetical protein